MLIKFWLPVIPSGSPTFRVGRQNPSLPGSTSDKMRHFLPCVAFNPRSSLLYSLSFQ